MLMFDAMTIGKTHIVVDRRKFLAGAASLIAAGILPKHALALAGPHSFKQGNYDLTVVSDGQLTLPLALFPDAKPEEVAKLLGPMAKGDMATFEASPLLLKSGSDVILMDNGSGGNFSPTAGKIAESLKAAGVEPSAVTKVIFTHAHPDHCWGTIAADGKPNFPNATLHMAETEWNFWSAPDLVGKMPAEMKKMVEGIQAQLTGMKEKINFFKAGAEVLPGINALDTNGHTPGHISFELSGGDGLIVTGDAIVNPMIFFAHPDWKFGFDADPAAAIASRTSLLDMAASGKKQLLGYHWPYPGLGRAEKKDNAYVYVPA
jgi:glyoxylase-like metal-dependent hydrolase (beta-lactamase superfamily II)